MLIRINDERTIAELQDDFQKAFANLKIEFFSTPHHQGQSTAAGFRIGGQTLIGNLRALHTNGFITLSPENTVAELESHFRDLYGLNVQVFRKQGEEWLETTKTDYWTLGRQNQQDESIKASEVSTGTPEIDLYEQE